MKNPNRNKGGRDKWPGQAAYRTPAPFRHQKSANQGKFRRPPRRGI